MYWNFNHVSQAQFDEGIACVVIATAAIAVRLFCKIKYKQGIHSDDYWILVGTALLWAMNVLVTWGKLTSNGGGIEAKELTMLVMKDKHNAIVYRNYLISYAIGVIIYWAEVFALKISVLVFYRRIFFITEGYQRVSLAVIIFTTAWYISTMVAYLLSYQPFDAFWNLLKPGKRFNFVLFYLLSGVFDTLIDVIILLLPIRMAFCLHLPLRTKVGVAAIFALGGFVVISNIIRLSLVCVPGRKYLNLNQDERWCNIHALTAIVCACLPVYKPLWNSFYKSTGDFLSRSANSLRSKRLGSSSGGSSKGANKTSLDMAGLAPSGGSLNSDTRDLEHGSLNSKEKSLVGQPTLTTVVVDDDDFRLPFQVPRGYNPYSR